MARFDSRFRRLLRFVGLERKRKRCGDFWLEDLPPDSAVREPRQPTPPLLSGAVALELPELDD